MAQQVGHVDDRGRPLLRIELRGTDESFLALVDTGCNASLVLPESEAMRLGMVMTGLESWVEFADGRKQLLRACVATLIWLGAQRRVEALVTTPDGSVSMRPNARADEPIGLVGTGLLSPHLLTINFATADVIVAAID